MIKLAKNIGIAFLVILLIQRAQAQDPVLPPVNLGTSNMLDGFSPGAGLYYINYTQVYQTKSIQDGTGNIVDTDLEINSLLSLHQIIYQTDIGLLGGALGFTVLLPIVKISADNTSGMPSVNSDLLGDLVTGAAIQWNDKKIFGKTIFHRAEINAVFPTGSYSSKYNINPSSHAYNFAFYHSLTLFITKEFSMSFRNQFNYNSKIIDSGVKPGTSYNLNYAIEYTLYKTLRAEIAGYYLKQLSEDSYNGNHQYYQDNFNIKTTKEQVFAIGPGMSYLTRGGLFMEGKVFFEMSAENRTQGIRPTLRIAYKLN